MVGEVLLYCYAVRLWCCVERVLCSCWAVIVFGCFWMLMLCGSIVLIWCCDGVIVGEYGGVGGARQRMGITGWGRRAFGRRGG